MASSQTDTRNTLRETIVPQEWAGGTAYVRFAKPNLRQTHD
jgi:hypothetical protein